MYLPNLLSLARLAMVPWLVILLNQQQFGWSLAVFVVAGISDALDGIIAKRFDAQTALGAILDPLADKVLLVSSYIMLSVGGYLPFWLMVVVVFRDAVIVGGYVLMMLFFGSVKMRPLIISKANTCSQITYVVILLATLSWSLDMDMLLTVTSLIVLFTSVVSGSIYVYIWSVKATTQASPRATFPDYNKVENALANQNTKDAE